MMLTVLPIISWLGGDPELWDVFINGEWQGSRRTFVYAIAVRK